MKAPSAIAAASVAIGVFAGGVAIGHFVTDDSGSAKSSGRPQVLGQTFTRTPGTSTSTVPAAAAPAAPPTSQGFTPATAAPAARPSTATQSATVSQTQTQTTSPPATSTVVVANAACGSGTATASVSSQTFPHNKTANTDYETDATASVHNGVDKPIQIDSLTIRLYYEDGGTQDVIFNNAVGATLQPGVTNNYSVAVNTGQRQVRTNGVGLQSFSFHTAGHPECAGRPA